MSGLLSGVLPALYSASNKLQRNVNGLLDNPKNYLAGLLMDANTRAGGLLDATTAATQETSANMAAGSGLFQGPANNKLAGMLADAYGPAGLTVWHGSPHKFAKFDASKIGTGEGAQAYGHGLYFSESPAVAQEYKRQLATKFNAGNLSYDGATGRATGSTGNGLLDDYILANVGDVNATRAQLLKDIKDIRSNNPEGVRQWQQSLADLRNVRSSADVRNTGSLYKVDLPDEHIAKMLDWDKPLSGQAPGIQDAWGKFLSSKAGLLADKSNRGALLKREGQFSDPTGKTLHDVLAEGLIGVGKPRPFNQVKAEATEMLRKQGIPGIRYLDGGSRGTGAGTSNFVVFPGNEGLLQILERNGIPMR
jgi:hypothetical protein